MIRNTAREQEEEEEEEGTKEGRVRARVHSQPVVHVCGTRASTIPFVPLSRSTFHGKGRG